MRRKKYYKHWVSKFGVWWIQYIILCHSQSQSPDLDTYNSHWQHTRCSVYVFRAGISLSCSIWLNGKLTADSLPQTKYKQIVPTNLIIKKMKKWGKKIVNKCSVWVNYYNTILDGGCMNKCWRHEAAVFIGSVSSLYIINF